MLIGHKFMLKQKKLIFFLLNLFKNILSIDNNKRNGRFREKRNEKNI